MNTFDQAVFSAPGAGRPANGFGPHLIRISSDQTGGRLGVFEAEIPPGAGPPPHVHEAEDEVICVLSGHFAFWCNDTHTQLAAGGVIVIPRGAVHRFENAGEMPGRLMVMVTPGGFEGAFGAIEAAAPQAPQQIDAIAAQYNMRFVPALAAA